MSLRIGNNGSFTKELNYKNAVLLAQSNTNNTLYLFALPDT
jgi:hypothetical protein